MGEVLARSRVGDSEPDIFPIIKTNIAERTFEERGAAREDNIGEQRSPQVHIRLLNCKDQHFMQPLTFLPNQIWTEEELRGPESGRANLQRYERERV